MKGCLVLFISVSTPSNNGGGHPDPDSRGGGGLKFFFRPFGPQFGLKMRGDTGPPAPPLDPPLLFTNIYEISTVFR